MQPEELTELFDEDLEMWALGGTRILPKSQLERARPSSIPPVAFPSTPPPPPAMSIAPAPSNGPLIAAASGMAAMFFLAAAAGGIFYALHRAPTQSITVASMITTAEPENVTLVATTDPVTVTTAAPVKATPKVT